MTHLPDYEVAAFWVLSTAVLGTVGWLSAGRLFPGDAVRNKVAHTIVFCWAHVVAVATALGTVGLLLPTPLLVGVPVSAVLTFILIARRDDQLASLTGDIVLPTAGWNEPEAEGLWPVVWAIVFAFWTGYAIMGGLLRFPDDWDTLMYHLPLVDHWLQAQSLYAPDGLRWSDPGNNELITLWLVAPFSGDFLYGLTNLPAAILLGCGAVELGRQLGLSVAFRHLAGLVVVANYVLLKQLTDTENDVAVAALFLTSLSYVWRYANHARIADLAFGAVCLGLLSGVKYYALGYASVVTAVAALLVMRRQGSRAVLRAAALGFVGCAVFGGYWYVRNWLAGGSPFFPLWAPDESADLRQVYPNIWQSTFVGNGRSELFPLALQAVWGMTGPCHLAALIALPATLAWLVVSGFQRTRWLDDVPGRAGRLGLALVALASGAVLIVTPFAVEDVPGTLNQMHWQYCPVRYGLCFLSSAVLVLAVVLQDISRGFGLRAERGTGGRSRLMRILARGPLVLLAAGAVFQLTEGRNPEFEAVFGDTAMLATDIALAGALIYLVERTRPRFRWPLVIVLGLTAAGGAALATDRLAERWHRGFEAHYDHMLGGGLFQHLNRTQPAGSGICVLDLRAYPFFGSARQFRMHQPAPIHSRQWLVDYVRSHEITLVAARFETHLPSQGWRNCRLWLIEEDRVFIRVQERPWRYTVFRVASSER